MPTEKIFKKPKVLVWPLVFLLLAALDQLFKHFAENIFKNYRFAFSLPVPAFLMYVIYFLAVGGIIYYIAAKWRIFLLYEKLAWMLILTGAFLNIGERIMLGYVRDFIYVTFFRWTGIYNLADGYIILGIIFLIIKSKYQK